MKLSASISLSIAFFLSASAFALTIPSDGSDGAFNPTTSVEIDLTLATKYRPDTTSSVWSDNNAANVGNGVYDRAKWAIVFKYSSVNIPAGVTVTFKNHETHAPVVWLVQGNVTIDGELNLRGKGGTGNLIAALTPPQPGPGGFRGGTVGPLGTSAGYGIGGSQYLNGGGIPAQYFAIYGNPQIIPLIGGSGAQATNPSWGNLSGGAGGGAILIATSQAITINGTIDVQGGSPPNPLNSQNNWGSCGAVRLIADTVSGVRLQGNPPNIVAVNQGMFAPNQYAPYSQGRVRIEANSLSLGGIEPNTIRVTPPAIPIIWPADNAPTVRVVSVDGGLAPADPTAPVINETDVPIQNNGTVQVVLQTTNFPVSGIVQLRAVQKFGAASWLSATYTSGDFAQANWLVNTAFVPGFTTLQARATVP